MEGKMPNMRRWTDAKLEKELAFAYAAHDESEVSAKWIIALEAEAKRRRS
jgi:hypothetical protein